MPRKLPENVIAHIRKDGDREYLFVQNYGNAISEAISLGQDFVDMDTGNTVSSVQLKTYDVIETGDSTLIRVFGRAFEKQWFTDNKPHGFDVQDHRIGALLYRTDACRRRIFDYTSGKIERIDELEEKLLPYCNEGESANINRAPLYATVNIIHMNCVP